MNNSQERKVTDVSREKAGADNLRLSYLPKDDIRRYPYQYPGRGIAVSGFVFSLAHLFCFGLVPPLACLGVIGSVIAYLKGNRQNITYLGFAFGVIGLIISIWVTIKFGGYVANPSAFLEMFADASSTASGTSSAAVSSIAEAISSAAG